LEYYESHKELEVKLGTERAFFIFIIGIDSVAKVAKLEIIEFRPISP